jgi:hypothetical protein
MARTSIQCPRCGTRLAYLGTWHGEPAFYAHSRVNDNLYGQWDRDHDHDPADNVWLKCRDCGWRNRISPRGVARHLREGKPLVT